jgi:hypothetical protein
MRVAIMSVVMLTAYMKSVMLIECDMLRVIMLPVIILRAFMLSIIYPECHVLYCQAECSYAERHLS